MSPKSMEKLIALTIKSFINAAINSTEVHSFSNWFTRFAALLMLNEFFGSNDFSSFFLKIAVKLLAICPVAQLRRKCGFYYGAGFARRNYETYQFILLKI